MDVPFGDEVLPSFVGMKMKILKGWVASFAMLVVVGCGSSGNTTVTEGVSESEKDEYNRMVAEADSQMQQSADAEAALLKSDPKGIGK